MVTSLCGNVTYICDEITYITYHISKMNETTKKVKKVCVSRLEMKCCVKFLLVFFLTHILKTKCVILYMVMDFTLQPWTGILLSINYWTLLLTININSIKTLSNDTSNGMIHENLDWNQNWAWRPLPLIKSDYKGDDLLRRAYVNRYTLSWPTTSMWIYIGGISLMLKVLFSHLRIRVAQNPCLKA